MKMTRYGGLSFSRKSWVGTTAAEMDMASEVFFFSLSFALRYPSAFGLMGVSYETFFS